MGGSGLSAGAREGLLEALGGELEQPLTAVKPAQLVEAEVDELGI